MLEVIEVRKRYLGSEALKGVSFQVPSGQVVGILGLNGAGKTTLLKLIGGLLLPDGGAVRLMGKSPREQRGHIVYLPEKNPWPEAATPKRVAALLAGTAPGFDGKRFFELVRFLAVPDKPFSQMSKGERARANLALALARRAPLYLLDEPLAGIDLISRDRILKALVHEWREEASLLVSTHEVGEAEAIFDRAIFLKEGEVVADVLVERLREEGKDVVTLFKEVLA